MARGSQKGVITAIDFPAMALVGVLVTPGNQLRPRTFGPLTLSTTHPENQVFSGAVGGVLRLAAMPPTTMPTFP